MSTFNGGKSRNIKVNSYNTATGESSNTGTRSIFSGGTGSIAPYANIGKTGTSTAGGMGFDEYKGIKRSTLHNNTVYDISLINIIEQLSGTQAELRPSDFAYLKDIGVYPNNRLMIARRFQSPQADNIYKKAKGVSAPMAIMISWKPQGEDFINISFGEEWQDANADFKNVLDSLGEDFLGKDLGKRIGGAGAAIPLPGFTEQIQRVVLTKLGVLKEGSDNDPLPSGNPNLIKMAKRRKTVASEAAGSGLKCSVSVTMICEWEQKFISGLDPTIVYQDILSRILTFATSNSYTYGLTSKFNNVVNRWMEDPRTIVTDMVTFIKEGLGKAKEEIKKLIDGLTSSLSGAKDSKEASEKAKLEENKKLLGELGTDPAQKIIDGVIGVLSKQLQKYKIEIEGIARSLSGAPSTPWHVTIGNPLRPVFCAGDMYMEQDIKLTLGPTLAFNDLPSSIKAEFTLQNARPWGLQEIAAKFNSGSIRTVTVVKDANMTNAGESIKDGKITPDIQSNSSANANSITGGNNSLTNVQSAVSQPALANQVATNVQQANPIPTVAAGPQAQEFPTFANNFGQNLPNTSQFTGGINSAFTNAQNNVANVQNQVSGVATSTTSTISSSTATAIGTTKVGSDTGQQIVADANSSIATTLSGINIGSFV
jgi:hypothetical protein